jgi:signal transduction histidine kinase
MNLIERIFRPVSRFRSKQRLVIMLACSIVLAATLFSSLAYNYYSFKLESRERLIALGDIIGADVGAALAFADNQAVAKSLEPLKADPSVKLLFVLDMQDQISAYYHPDADAEPADLQQHLKKVRSEAEKFTFDFCLEVERPIIRDSVRLGTILIELDEHTFKKKISDSAVIGVFILLLALGFSFLLADRFQIVITKPVAAMATTMQEVSNTKDYSKRVPSSGTDEMDRLAVSFNEMLQEIELRDKELLEHQYQLEQLAEELTCSNLRQLEISESNRRLEEISRTKSDFLANMSHELRTPLNSVVGFSEVLQDQMFGPINEKQQEYLKNILTSGKHLLSMINDILDLSKVESGKMELELSRFLIREAMGSSMMMLREKALKGGISLSMELAPMADLEIVADQRRLKQILYNLLSNAVKFTPAGGAVRLTARRVQGSMFEVPGYEEHNEPRTSNLEPDADFIEISVEDSGIGISEEDIPRLFQAFTQLESLYTKEYEGTGLGLALARHLVQLHGGVIWVKSRLGSGSSFSFTIPLAQTLASKVRSTPRELPDNVKMIPESEKQK